MFLVAICGSRALSFLFFFFTKPTDNRPYILVVICNDFMMACGLPCVFCFGTFRMPKYWPVVRAAMCSGLYPNLVRVDYGKKKFKVSALFALALISHAALSLPPSPVCAWSTMRFFASLFSPPPFSKRSCLFFEAFLRSSFVP